MMREILFRGKRTVTGKWVEGDLRQLRSCTAIYDVGVPSGGYIVNPDTVGQYTGLEDKNGKQIFEGDIVKSSVSLHVSEVYFSHGKFTLKCKCHGGGLLDICGDVLKVIGNIHDNPELLVVEHESCLHHQRTVTHEYQ